MYFDFFVHVVLVCTFSFWGEKRETERERAKIKLTFSPFFLSVRCHVEFI